MSLWGGRFGGDMSEVTRAFTGDTSDRRLLEVDVEGSLAHVGMLGQAGIISEEDSATLAEGLRQIREEGEDFEFYHTDEDVHSAVERRLRELVGDVAGKLHTGRSRNDQIALDLRLYLRRAADERVKQIDRLVDQLRSLADTHAETVVASYTHLQQAQATSLGHHFLAYAWMLTRDAERFRSTQHRLAVSPLGSGASAGSMLPIDREKTAEALGLYGVMPNSLDAVGSRDFVSDYVFCCGQTMVHLSRLAEEIVLWATREFAWVTLGDEVSTGSSALPQKRNPDIAELVRGRTSGVIGDLTSILTLQKALPLAYNRDLQEDKRIVFHADDTVAGAIDAMKALLAGTRFDPPAPGTDTTALDLAEALVSRGTPFREAHQVVGRLVRHLENDGRSLDQVTAADLLEVDDRFEEPDLDLLDPVASMSHRATEGSGSPDSVRRQLDQLVAAWRNLNL